MGKHSRLLSLRLLAIVLMCSGVSMAAEITGHIRQADGTPLAGATIRVSTARLRTGSSPMCPSCWADCAKSAQTDASGNFRIPNVNDKLVFRLLALADGFMPSYIDKVDPAVGPANATLEVRDLSAFTEAQMLKGTVTDDMGRPIAGATIAPAMSQYGLEDMALSNLQGEFVLTSSMKIRKGVLEVHAEGYAKTKVETAIKSGAPVPVEVKLGRGVFVTGRVLHHGKPVPSVTMSAAQTGRAIKTFVGPTEALTDEDGTFLIMCVPPRDKVAVYGTMESFADLGAVSLRIIETGADETTIQLGDLEIGEAATLTGRLHLTDGRTFPEGTRIHLGRRRAWDSLVVDVSPDGHFEAMGIPLAEAFSLSIPPDYEIQAVPPGFTLDPLNNLVKGSLDTPRSDLKVDLAWKDRVAEENERFEGVMREQYGDFFASAKLTPDQIAAFVSVYRDSRAVWIEASKQDEIPLGILHEQFIAKELASRLGEKYLALYLQYESLRNGRDFLDGIISVHEGDWIEDEEKERLVPLVAAELEKTTNHWGTNDLNKAPLQERIDSITRMFADIDTACAPLLPPSKLKILRECLDVARQEYLKEAIHEEEDEG
ncbi:MAG TPA: carboxypeptidase-like regulatory domain-containing protein [Bacteroidia bacterium]|nr:carboxypeptidase-like regulatory domain-containing protein [Bacteroidia bacterium]